MWDDYYDRLAPSTGGRQQTGGVQVMGQALTEREIEAVVREVTDEEVAFYHEYGWVMMKQLVD